MSGPLPKASASGTAPAPHTPAAPRPPTAPRAPHPALGPRWRALVYWQLGTLALSGGVWLYLHALQGPDGLPDPAQPWAMRVHGAATMVFLFWVGRMYVGHMRPGWQRGRNRIAGALLSAVLLSLALTGYGLYYFSGDGLRAVTEWAHWIGGGLAPVLLWIHVLGRRKRSGEARQPR